MNPFTILLDLQFDILFLNSTRLFYNAKLQQPQKEKTKGLVHLLSFDDRDKNIKKFEVVLIELIKKCGMVFIPTITDNSKCSYPS
ncbi:MAG: hypothetical protein K9J16_08190 [Melioribacteraceae bacterium]|nr:hypothetical protein [Melioribacteraceae bacterium]MCF8353882.1 hypothetical protein [Melioribacteraceae bacterium]MCF8393115.1 hypothetical protein [Melioribacteraceae bacterium]MCF8419234.1 hypothetical protein [Melioribacteraceae bacterium]